MKEREGNGTVKELKGIMLPVAAVFILLFTLIFYGLYAYADDFDGLEGVVILTPDGDGSASSAAGQSIANGFSDQDTEEGLVLTIEGNMIKLVDNG